MRSLFQEIDFRCENVIANPPFETAECAEFLRWLGDVRQGRIVAAGGVHRQAATQDDAERRAEVLHALSDTHAGIVRKDKLQG